jgi:outer membrane protein assembly factor BamE (lipoprotein component of BamABCDE complex)
MNKATLAIAALLMCSCAPKRYGLGVAMRPDQIAEVGNAKTKADVVKILGSPQAITMFGTEKWFYADAKGTAIAFFEPTFSQYNITAISFDADNNVSGVETRDVSERDFAQADGNTALPGAKEDGFFAALFGNVGRMNMGGMGDPFRGAP